MNNRDSLPTLKRMTQWFDLAEPLAVRAAKLGLTINLIAAIGAQAWQANPKWLVPSVMGELAITRRHRGP